MRLVPGAPFRLPFQRKLLLAFATVLLPVVGVLGVDILQDTRATRDTLLDAQAFSAHAVAVQVAESFEAAIDLGWAVANDPLVRTLDSQRLDTHLLRLTGHSARLSSIGVFDAQGLNRGWGNSQQPAEPRLWIGDRPYFQQAMSTNAPVLSGVLDLKRTSRTALIVAVPLRDEQGRPMGVVALVIETGLLAQRYLTARNYSHQEILLVDPQGRIAFHTTSPSLPFSQGMAFAPLEPLQASLRGQPARMERAMDPLTGEAMLGAFVPTPRYHWAVGVMTRWDPAMAPLTRRLHTKLAAGLGIAAFSGLLAMLLARRQTRPVRQLHSFAQSLGRGDMGRRVHIQTGDEMEELGVAFNQMAEQIGQRQREVDALRAGAEDHARQLAAIISSVPDAILLATPDGRLSDANPAGMRLLGLSDHARLDEPLSDHLNRSGIQHAGGQPLRLEELPLVRALRGDTFTDLELRMKSCTGEEHLVSVNGAPVRDATGRIILGEVVIHDITERKRIERERARLLEREQALSRIGQALVREVELERIASVASEQCRQALGLEAVGLWLAHPDPTCCRLVAAHGLVSPPGQEAGVIPLTVLARLPAGPRAEVFHAIDLHETGAPPPALQRLARREGFSTAWLRLLSSQGRPVGVLVGFSREPLALSASEQEFHATVGQLIAVALEKALLFQQVREALRLREEFMSAAAHELKTPVTTLQTWADILTWKEGVTERQRKGLAAISRGARRLGQLVEHLFTALRMTPDTLKMERDRVDLRALLTELVTRLSRTTDHPIHLRADEALIIDADRQRMSEVLGHLLENAIRYSPPSRPIEVQLGCADNEALVSIHDHGPGIPPERQPHVFEPLYEPLPSGATGYAGMAGMGLHLSSRIIEAHGGRIWLESAPEAGTTFRFSLPLTNLEGTRHANA